MDYSMGEHVLAMGETVETPIGRLRYFMDQLGDPERPLLRRDDKFTLPDGYYPDIGGYSLRIEPARGGKVVITVAKLSPGE